MSRLWSSTNSDGLVQLRPDSHLRLRNIAERRENEPGLRNIAERRENETEDPFATSPSGEKMSRMRPPASNPDAARPAPQGPASQTAKVSVA